MNKLKFSDVYWMVDRENNIVTPIIFNNDVSKYKILTNNQVVELLKSYKDFSFPRRYGEEACWEIRAKYFENCGVRPEFHWQKYSLSGLDKDYFLKFNEMYDENKLLSTPQIKLIAKQLERSLRKQEKLEPKQKQFQEKYKNNFDF